MGRAEFGIGFHLESCLPVFVACRATDVITWEVVFWGNTTQKDRDVSSLGCVNVIERWFSCISTSFKLRVTLNCCS